MVGVRPVGPGNVPVVQPVPALPAERGEHRCGALLPDQSGFPVARLSLEAGALPVHAHRGQEPAPQAPRDGLGA